MSKKNASIRLHPVAQNRIVRFILLFFATATIFSQNEAAVRVFYGIIYIVLIYMSLVLLLYTLNQKIKCDCLEKCTKKCSFPFLWIEQKLTKSKSIRVSAPTTIILILSLTIWLIIFFIIVAPSKGHHFENAETCWPFVFYILFSVFTILLTRPCFANYVNYYFWAKNNLNAQYEPEIVRRVFLAVYFILLIFQTYWSLYDKSVVVVSKYVFEPAFLTYIAYDAAFYREYQLDLRFWRALDRIMIKHF